MKNSTIAALNYSFQSSLFCSETIHTLYLKSEIEFYD